MTSFPSIEKVLLLNVVSGLSVGREWLGALAAEPTPDGPVPDTAIYDSSELAILRQLCRDGQEPAVSLVKALCETADRALKIGPLSVTLKPGPPPGGSLNDYYSLAKYWWPNDASPDGLPYVRRDGQVNPACYSASYDVVRLVEFAESAHTLALAAFLSEREKYAEKAVELIDAWLLNEASGQNPHFEFAQTIPGHEGARAPAIIEARHLISVTEAARILHHLGAVKSDQFRQLQDWFAALLGWLRTSACGRAAARASNNIAFWHDAQCLAYAEFVGDAEVIEHIVHTSIPRRLDEQVDYDGGLPGELSREKPNDYVAFTLAALAIIGAVAKKRGVDLWDYRTSDGRSFEAVHEWLISLPASKGGKWAILAGLADLSGDHAASPSTVSPEADRTNRELRLELGVTRRLSERRRQAIIARDALLRQARNEHAQLERQLASREFMAGGSAQQSTARQQDAEAERRSFEHELKRRDQQIAELKKLEETAKTEAAALAARAKAEEERAAALAADLNARNAEAAELADLKGRQEARIASLEEQIAELKKLEETAKTEAAALAARAKAEEERAAALAADLNARNAEAAELADLKGRQEARIASLEEQLTEAKKRAREFGERAETAEQAYNKVLRSSSWRITAPLRGATGAWRTLGRRLRGVSRAEAVSDTSPPSKLKAAAKALPKRAVEPTEPLDTHRPIPELPPVPKPDVEALRAEYIAKGLDREPDTFVLYRVIGNDLFPRHRKGQSRDNVRFILDHEPALEACEKRWVVNRIVDPDEEAAILALLEERGQSYLRIPFDWDEYRRVPWDFESFPEPGFFLRGAFTRLNLERQERAEMQVRRHKNNYVMNNNGARNAALADGRGRAKWVLPWDGNCFLTEAAWVELVAAVQAAPHLKYFVVPMARITDNQALLDPGFRPEAVEEPQILFRRDAAETFNEAFPYGRRPKVELFWRLGIPGNWDRWRDDLWDPERPRQRSAEAGQFGQAGWVARLFSGQAKLEESATGTIRARGFARNEAIQEMLDTLDKQALLRTYDPLRLTAYDEAAVKAVGSEIASGQAEKLLGHLLHMADEALERPPPSVIDKTSLPPSGDVHDYWHPAPYWWPNPKTKDGLPYVRRDGERVPGTRMYEPESERYDRTRLQCLFDDTTVLALAWQATGKLAYAEHGARMVRRWFVDPQTRMNPHLRYAQVRMGHNNNEGVSTGIIEFKDFYYFLDAVRLLARAETLLPVDLDAVSGWLRDYLDWLQNSKQGQRERWANNNHGTCYDLQVGAIAAYLGDTKVLLSTLRTSQERLIDQFAPDGRQPHEMERTLTAHYTAFNLQSWANLATLAERCGHDLWHVTTSDGRGLRRVFAWLAPYMAGTEWPWPQIEPFDRDRYWPLYFAACDQYGMIDGLQGVEAPDRLAAKPVFFPHDGIKPFWTLG